MAALAFDFGEPGKAAVGRLSQSRNLALAAPARAAMSKERPNMLVSPVEAVRQARALDGRLRVFPAGTIVPDSLRLLLIDPTACGADERQACTLRFLTQGREAVALRACLDDLSKIGDTADDSRRIHASCAPACFRLINDRWVVYRSMRSVVLDSGRLLGMKAALAAGEIEFRAADARQVSSAAFRSANRSNRLRRNRALC